MSITISVQRAFGGEYAQMIKIAMLSSGFKAMKVSPKAQSQLSFASSTLRVPIFGVLKHELSDIDSKAVKTSTPKILSLEDSFPIYLTKFRGLQSSVFQSNHGNKMILQTIVGYFPPSCSSDFCFSMRKPISISRKLPLHY